MNWVLITNKRNVLQEYRLMDDNEPKVIVKYNPIHSSARIITGDKQRLFFIESTGSLSGKYILKNEYGLISGMINNEKWGKEGSVTIESTKFNYRIDNTPPGELTVYNGSNNKALVSCGLATGINGTSLSISSPYNNADCNYLLLALCWFLLLPAANKKMVEYAA